MHEFSMYQVIYANVCVDKCFYRLGKSCMSYVYSGMKKVYCKNDSLFGLLNLTLLHSGSSYKQLHLDQNVKK